MNRRAGLRRLLSSSLLAVALTAGATVQASTAVWAQPLVDAPETLVLQTVVAPSVDDLDIDVNAEVPPSDDGSDVVVQADLDDSDGIPPDTDEVVLPFEVEEGFDVTEGLAPDLLPEEIEGHELGSDPLDLSSAGLLDDDGVFEWQDGDETMSLRLLPAGEAAALAFSGLDSDAATTATTATTKLQDLAESMAAVSYVPTHDGLSNETSAVVQQQADNWFVSDTGQLFLPVGGVLILFEAGLSVADINALWTQYNIDLRRVSAVEGLPHAFMIDTSSDAESLKLVQLLSQAPGVESVTPNMFTPAVIDVSESVPVSYPSINTATINVCTSNNPPLSDALSACLWHFDRSKALGLIAGGKTYKPQVDINIGEVWKTTQGDGITVSVVDNTWEAGHEDLVGNANRAASTNWGGLTGETGTHAPWHATAVAGIIGARDNTIGGRGVAPRASLLNVNYVHWQNSYSETQRFLHRANTVAVANHSYAQWGNGRLYRMARLSSAALEQSLESGFGGKGTLHVKGAGNGKDGGFGDEASLEENNSHYGVVVACAVNSAGTSAIYSEEGPNLWVCGPSGEKTASRHDLLSTIGKNHYHVGLRGTSFSAPMVSGVAALVRSANKNLTWRDVKLILAGTAQKNDSSDSSWQSGAFKYGSTTDSYSYSRKYGFGLVDASAAVTAAQNWKLLPPMISASASAKPAATISKADGSKEFTLNLSSDISFVEHVDVNIDMETPHFRSLKLTLVSPSGKESVLVNPSFAAGRLCLCSLYGDFKFASVRHLGETSTGTWKLKIENINDANYARLDSWGVTVYGHNPSRTEVLSLSTQSTVTEGDDTTISVTHTGAPLTSDLIVPIVVTPGSGATPPGKANPDYTELKSITIPAGSNKGSATISTTEDNTHELTEAINIKIGALQAPHVSNGIAKQIFILDDDQPIVTIKPARTLFYEGEDIVFELTMDRKPAKPLEVWVEVTEEGRPRIYMTHDWLIQANKFITGKPIKVAVKTVLDQIDEPDRVIRATINSSTSYKISGKNPVTVTMSDDLPRVRVASDGDIEEGEDASFTLTAFPAPSAPLTVAVSVKETGYFGVDTSTRTVTIDTSGTAKLTIPTVKHRFNQPDGSVTVKVQSSTDDSYYPVPRKNSVSATANITDIDNAAFTVDATLLAKARAHSTSIVYMFKPDIINLWRRVLLAFGDNPSGVTGGAMTATEAQTYADNALHADWTNVAAELRKLEAAQARTPVVIIDAGPDISEGDDATFTLRALPGPASDLEVDVTLTSKGSFDVDTTPQTVTIPTNGTATLTIPVDHDSTDGADGAVTVTVVDGTSYDVYSKPSASVAVSDYGAGAPLPRVSIFSEGDVTEASWARFKLTANPVPTSPIKVRWNASGSNNFGVFGSTTGTIFISSRGVAYFSVAVIDDLINEPDGYVTVTLADGTDYDLKASASAATVNIADDDIPVISITSSKSKVTEGSPASFKVLADPWPHSDLDVNVAVTASGDYGVTAGSHTVTIPAAGNTAGRTTLDLATTGDSTSEADGSVTATLVDSTNYDLKSSASAATVNIVDDDDPSVISVTAGSAITEGGNAQFTITPKPIPKSPLTINYRVTTSGDYGVTTGTKTITIGTNTASTTFSIATTGDTTNEADGSVTVTLVDDAAYDLDSSASSATVNITDDDVPEISIAAGSNITEGANASFTLTADPTPHSSITVNVTVSATGSYGVTTGSQTVTIPTSGTVTFTVATTGDSTDEADGSVTATLNTGNGYTLDSSASAATVNIADDDVPEISIAAGSDVTEGNSASFKLTADPTPHTSIDVTVKVTATGSYGVTTGNQTVTIPTSGTATLTVATTGDTVDEVDGSVTATLVDGATYNLDSSASAATVAVTDNDVPTVGITAGTAVTEGGSASFTLTASPVPKANLDVTVAVTATGNYGVTTGNQTVTIPTSGTATLTIATTDDSVDEATGTVTATLVDGAAYDLDSSASAAAVYIADDDIPEISIASGNAVTEGSNATFTLTADPVPKANLDVTVAVTATGNYGVTTGNQTVTIPTSGTATLTIATTGDSADEANGSVSATLIDGAGYDLDSLASTATVAVTDDDVPEVSITAGNNTVTEGSRASFTLAADPAPYSSITVNVTVTASGDYGVTTGSRTVTIPTSGTATLTIATTGDTTDEADGSVTVTVNTGNNYTLDSSASAATVAITDNDVPTVGIAAGSGVTEGSSASFTLTASPAPKANLDVTVTVTASGSYGVTTGNQTVTIGTTGTATLAIATTGDAINEANGSVTATLVDGAAYDLDSSASAATVNISDDDVPEVSITAGSNITEGSNATFTVTANPAPASNLDVTVAVTATGSYGVTTGSQTITIGTSGTATLTIATTGDTTDEANGSVTATLNTGSGYNIDSTASAATVNIADDDVPEVSITAGSNITEGANASFTLTADPTPHSSITVNITVSATGAYGVTTGSQTVTIPTSGTATLTVATTGDTTNEANGTVTVTLNTGTGYNIDSTASTATVNVADDDAAAVYVVPAQLITDVQGYATETDNGEDHVNRWKRVLLAFGENVPGFTGTPITLIEAQGFANQFWSTRWDPVVIALQALANNPQTPTTPEISITAGSNITEGSNATFTVTANPAPASNLDVTVAVTATGSYGVTTGSQTITIGTSGTATLTIATTGDTTDEANGSVTATLNTGSGYNIDSTASAATVNIADDDVPEVSITAGSNITEGANASFTLTADPTPHSSITVNITVSATGAYGVTTGSQTVTIPTSGTATLTVATTGDTTNEANGTVTVTVNTGTGYNIDSTASTATVNVADDDAAAVYVVPAQLITDVQGYATETDNGEDHVNRWKRVLLAFGENVPGFTGTPITLIEAQGFANQFWSTRWDPVVIALQALANNPQTPTTPEISITAGSNITEGSNATFTVTANPAPASNLDVTVAVTATGSYGVTTGSQTITIGTSGTATLTIATTGDTTDEANGSVTATLNTGSGYNIDSTASAATVNISDDDVPEVSITAGSNITEGSNATFTLTANPAPSANLDVTVAVTATGSYGVTTGSQTVTIPTSGTATLTIATTGDSTDEVNGSVTATLNTGSGYNIDSTASAATVNISDDDVPEVSITAGSNITEGSNATFTVTANPAPSANLDVNVAVTATGSYGVTTGSQTVTIPTSGTATLTVATTGDTTNEANGTVTVTVNTGTGYSIDSTASAATVNVADDDAAAVYVVPAQLITDVQGYATETDNGEDHVNRWKRVLLAFGEDVPGFTGTPMTLVEAQGFASQFWSTRWDPVVIALQALANNPQTPTTPEISITAGSNITEGSNATFTLTANPAPSANLDVTVAVTATGSYGVTTGSQTVTIPTSGTATLTIATTGDTTDEANGSVTATLNTGSGYNIDSTASAATVNIADDDVPEVSITAGSNITEGANASFTLTADPTPHSSITVNVTVSATGAYGVTTGSQTVTIPTSGTATLTVATTGDTTNEANGTVTVTVNTGTGYNIDSTASAATVNVADDDAAAVYVVPAQLITDVQGYATETDNGEDHVNRWKRVLLAFGENVPGFTGTPITLIEAQGFANQFWSTRWDPVVIALQALANNPQTPTTPEISITAGSNITEGSNASFTLTANPAPSANLNVTVAVTATGSYGVTTGNQTVTIGTSGTATLTIATTGDTTDEVNGSVTATLNTGSGYNIDSTASAATVNIADDDDPPVLPPPTPATPVVGVTAGSNVTEGGSASFTFTASPAPASNLNVTVTVSASGAYGVTTGNRTVTIPTSGTATFTIATTGDSTDEADGSVTVTVNTGNSYNVDSSASAATVAISDDDDPPVLPAVTPVVGVTAGNGITEGGTASFTFTASPAPASNLNVTVNVSASGSFGVNTGSRIVTIGTSGTATVTIATTGDTVDEANGSVTVTLADGAAYDLDSSASTATVAVSDDDVPEVSIAAGSDVTEGSNATFTLTADPAPHSSITVNVTVTASGDYGVTTGSRTVTIPTSGTATLTIATTGDTTDEANGSVTVTVNTGSNYTLDSSASTATVNITDDDDPPPPAPPADAVTISVEESTYVEGRSPFYLIRFKLSKPASERVTVKYTPGVLGTGAGYATAGEDFVVRTSSISFRPGATSNIGLIYALNDRVKEPDETFTIVLSEPQGVHISDKQPVLTIKDND